MDAKDEKICSALKADSRLSVREVAQRARLSVTTVHYRMRNLAKSGAIRYTARVNRRFSDRSLVAYVLVKAMPGVNHEKLFQRILPRPEVEEGAIVTGESDLIFKVSVRDMDALNGLVLKFLRLLPEVAETRTMVCYMVEEK